MRAVIIDAPGIIRPLWLLLLHRTVEHCNIR